MSDSTDIKFNFDKFMDSIVNKEEKINNKSYDTEENPQMKYQKRYSETYQNKIKINKK